MSHQNTNMDYSTLLAQGPSEEFVMRQLALSMAIENNPGLPADRQVATAEAFYEFLSAGKEKP